MKIFFGVLLLLICGTAFPQGFAKLSTGFVNPPICSSANLPTSGNWDSSSISPYTPPPGTPSYVFTNRPMAIIIDPFIPTTIWLFVSTNGLFKSTTCGSIGSWNLVSTGTNSAAINSGTGWSLHIDSNSGRAGTIYLTSSYNTVGVSGIYKSTNYGVDWTLLSIGNATVPASSINNFNNNVDLDANDTLHLVVSTHGGTSVSGYTNGAIAESFDGGNTWPNIVEMPQPWGEDGGPQIIPGTEGSGGAGTSSWVWGTGTGATGTYLTTNSGTSWTQIFTGSNDSANGEWSINPGMIKASNGQYYVSAIGALLTSANGTTWSEAWGTLNFAQAQLQSNVITTNTTIFSGGNQKLYTSPLGSSSWVSMTGIPTLVSGQDNVGWLAYDSTNHILYMTTQWQVFRYSMPLANQ